MADLFGSVSAPRLSFTPAQADTGELSRNFMSGVQLGQRARALALEEEQFRKRYDEGTLPNKLLAAQIITSTINNDVAKRNVDNSVEAQARMADVMKANPSEDDILNLPLSGNPVYDSELFKAKATALAMKNSKTEFAARKYVTDYMSNLFQAAPEDYWRFKATLDKEGNPTEATGVLQQQLRPKIESFQAKQAYISGKIPGGKPPAAIALTDEIIKTEAEANKAEKAGDTALATQLRDRATLLREQTKGQEVVTGYDDQGRPIIRMGKGVGVPTVATQSQAQQKLLRYENTIELLSHLDSVLKPEHLGAAGVTGEWIMDRGLSQLIPEVANKERIDARSALIAAREGLLREMSNDPRFSNIDREEISRALPSSGIFESLPDAKQRIDTVRQLIVQRGKVYAKGLGQPPPLWTMTADEIKKEYQKWQDTKGKQGVDKETALRALTRFH